MRRFFLVPFLVVSSLPSRGQSPLEISHSVETLTQEEKTLFKDLTNELRCPTCTGLSVLQSETPFSQQIKSAVIEQIREGKSQDEIMTFFKDRYGLWILRTPPVEGFHWIAWLFPLGIAVLGLFLLGRGALRRQSTNLGQGVRLTDDIRKEWEAELNSLRKAR
ncbi:MAG: cytochrome c-type biogenesis protein CcmH [Deltaproteobacteria bacterium]|nr:cytochrome c-type biogenesis protein CcmH [Deltaproteobacteria bacterium]